MDASEFLFPHDLAVTPTPIGKVLLIGSCMAEAYRDEFRAAAPGVTFDYLLFNNPTDLPHADSATIQGYDFQYIQLSLRHIVRDEIVNFTQFIADGVADALFERSCQLLRLFLDAALQYNRTHGLLSIVANFATPQIPVAVALDQIGTERDFASLIRRLNAELARLVHQHRNVYLADIDSVLASLGKRYVLDDVIGFYAHAHYWGAMNDEYDHAPRFNAPPGGRIEPLPGMTDTYESQAPQMFAAIWRQAECLYRTIHQIDMVKLVIFDLDDTLWRGQIAEHYGDGIPTPAFHGWVVGMWEAVQHLRARGIITAICSKNEESLVRERWHRAVMPWLALDDFPLREINWRPKADNVAALISQASVTPRSTIFVDDNPVERESVRAALPGIRILGANPHLTRRILLWSPETQLASRSQETAGREHSIRQLQTRETDRKALSRADFLRTLSCTVDIEPCDGPAHRDYARATELLNKTNQFNTTGIRWTQAQLAAFFDLGGRIHVFRVKDSYTEYGLVGTILYRDGGFAQVAMSCRVLGLEIETSVIHAIMQAAAEDGQTQFYARVFDTDANMVCRDLFARCGFIQAPAEPGLFIWPGGAIPPSAEHLRLQIGTPPKPAPARAPKAPAKSKRKVANLA